MRAKSNGTIYTHAGPEIGVASTKAFTAQLTALFLFSLLPRARFAARSPPKQAKELHGRTHPHSGEARDAARSRRRDRRRWRRNTTRVTDFLFLGRGIHYPIALEGALKLKEISYIHAEGYPAGEMKHGPNALIDEDLPVVIIATRDVNDPGSVTALREDALESERSESALGTVIAIATEGDDEIRESADHVSVCAGGTGAALADSGNRSAASCWRITSPCAADATSTNRGTWRSQ